MPAVRYEFIQSGADSIKTALRGIREEAELTARAVQVAFAKVTGGARAATGATVAAERAAQRGAAAEGRAAEQTARARKRAEDARYREVERAAAGYERQAQREARAAERAAEQRVRAEARANERIRADRLKFAGQVGRTVLGAVGSGVLAGAGAVVGTLGFATREQMRLQETATRISINARQPGEQGADPTALRREFEKTALLTPGVTAMDIAEGTQRFVSKTGDLGRARDLSTTFATITSASGARYEDIAATGADLMQKFGIQTKAEMEQALGSVYFGGKSGAFELADFAKKMAPIASAGQRFGIDKGVGGVQTMSGLAQIAMGATGDADRAATAVEATLRQLIAKTDVLKGQGVSVFDQRTGKTRNVTDVLVDTIGRVGGANAEKKATGLQKIFGDEGIRGISPLIATFNEAARARGGSDAERMAAGMTAVRRELDKAINATGSWAEVQKDAATAQSTSSAQLGVAWEALKAKVGDAVIPALSELIPKLTEAADGGLDPFIEALGLGVEAMTGMVAFLKDVGIIKAKEKTHAEKAVEAEKALKAFDERRAGKIGPLTPAEAAEREKLVDAYASESSQIWETPSERGKHMSGSEFAARYHELNPKMGMSQAKYLAENLARDPNSWVGNEYLRGLAGETEQQRDLRRNFQAQLVGDKAQGIDTTKLNEQAGETTMKLLALANAVSAAEKKLREMEIRGNILSGSQVYP